MSEIAAAGATALAIVLLGCVARDRMRAYGLALHPFGARAIAIGGGVTVMRGWLAFRGLGGLDTSIVLAIAAVAAITDLECGYVFDRVLLAGGALLVVAEAARGGIVESVAGGMAGALALAVPWALSRARGMGLGDVKLAGILGCGLGPYGALRTLWFAFAIGAMAASALLVTGRRSRGEALPFAPFLALGAVLSVGSSTW